jgi:hypothetical protein
MYLLSLENEASSRLFLFARRGDILRSFYLTVHFRTEIRAEFLSFCRLLSYSLLSSSQSLRTGILAKASELCPFCSFSNHLNLKDILQSRLILKKYKMCFLAQNMLYIFQFVLKYLPLKMLHWRCTYEKTTLSGFD